MFSLLMNLAVGPKTESMVKSWFTPVNKDMITKLSESTGDTRYITVYNTLEKNKKVIASAITSNVPEIIKLTTKLLTNKNVKTLSTELTKNGVDVTELISLSKSFFELAKSTDTTEIVDAIDKVRS